MMTTENTMMIVWFTPSRIEGRASGTCTFQSVCDPFAPYASAASTVSFGTWRIPRLVSRMPGGSA